MPKLTPLLTLGTLAIALCALTGCAKQSSWQVKAQETSLVESAHRVDGEATICVASPRLLDKKGGMSRDLWTVHDNAKLVGGVRPNTGFCYQVEPGWHALLITARSPQTSTAIQESLFVRDIQANTTLYLELADHLERTNTRIPVLGGRAVCLQHGCMYDSARQAQISLRGVTWGTLEKTPPDAQLHQGSVAAHTSPSIEDDTLFCAITASASDTPSASADTPRKDAECWLKGEESRPRVMRTRDIFWFGIDRQNATLSDATPPAHSPS